MKTLDDIKAARALWPKLSEIDVTVAIQAAGKKLSKKKLPKFTAYLNASLRDYCFNHFWETVGAGEPASTTAKRLRRVANACKKLIGALELNNGRPPDVLRLTLQREADFYAERIGGFADLPPREFVPVQDDRGQPIVTRKDFRSDEKLRQILEDLVLLEDLAEAAARYELQKVEKGKANPRRHEGDRYMTVLFQRINQDWFAFFREIPRAGFDAHKSKASGPYVRFLSAIFKTFREKIPAELDRYTPKLRRAFALTDDAIRARVRLSQK